MPPRLLILGKYSIAMIFYPCQMVNNYQIPNIHPDNRRGYGPRTLQEILLVSCCLTIARITVKFRHHIYDRPEEIVTPHQTTLLKLVDSYLESTQRNPTTSGSHAAEILKIHESLSFFLLRRFFSLSSYSQRSITRALTGTQPTTTKRNSPSEPMESASILSESLPSASSTSTTFPLCPPAELDAMLPKVCEALVLITQCIVTISLEAEEQRMLLQEGRSTLTNFKDMKKYFNEKKSSDQGIVESLIGLYCFSKENKLR